MSRIFSTAPLILLSLLFWVGSAEQSHGQFPDPGDTGPTPHPPNTFSLAESTDGYFTGFDDPWEQTQLSITPADNSIAYLSRSDSQIGFQSERNNEFLRVKASGLPVDFPGFVIPPGITIPGYFRPAGKFIPDQDRSTVFNIAKLEYQFNNGGARAFNPSPLSTTLNLEIDFVGSLEGATASVQIPVSKSFVWIDLGTNGELNSPGTSNVPILREGETLGYLDVLGFSSFSDGFRLLRPKSEVEKVPGDPDTLTQFYTRIESKSRPGSTGALGGPDSFVATVGIQAVIHLEAPQPEHIIVLSHGLSPGRDKSNPNYLIDGLKQPILDRLARDNVDLDTVHFVTQTWEEAYIPDFGDNPLTFLGNYNDAYKSTELVGRSLANEVSTLYNDLDDNGVKPTIHMIGHSLGSIVNAEAVSILNSQGVDVDLVTILDSPRQSSLRSAADAGVKWGKFRQTFSSFDASLLFYEKMPKDSVDFVENFYGGKLDLTPAFGQPIAGTLPFSSSRFSGRFLPELNHAQVWEDYYKSLIENDDSDWKTPALYGNEDFFPYSQDFIWNPTPLLDDVVERYNGLSLAEGALVRLLSVRWGVGDSKYIDAVQRTVGTIAFENTGVRAISNSPSAFSASANLDAVLGLEFSYLVEDAQSGILSLAFDNEVLWSIDLAETGTLLSNTVYVSVLDMEGLGELIWTYDSDELGSSALFSNLRIVVGIESVPEPSCLAILLSAVGILGWSGGRKRLEFIKNTLDCQYDDPCHP